MLLIDKIKFHSLYPLCILHQTEIQFFFRLAPSASNELQVFTLFEIENHKETRIPFKSTKTHAKIRLTTYIYALHELVAATKTAKTFQWATK